MKLAGLQTLRGIAANLVVFFHYFPTWLLIVVAVGSCNAAAFIAWKY